MPTAYSSLPTTTAAHDAVLQGGVARPVAPTVPVAALPVIRIPGTAIAHADAVPGQRVNPTDVLAASARARLAWQTLRPAELTRPTFVVNRDAVARLGVNETGAVGGGKAIARSETLSYDREAMMARLEKEGRSAAKPICSGC